VAAAKGEPTAMGIARHSAPSLPDKPFLDACRGFPSVTGTTRISEQLVNEPRPLPRHNWTPGLYICVNHLHSWDRYSSLQAYLGHRSINSITPALARVGSKIFGGTRRPRGCKSGADRSTTAPDFQHPAPAQITAHHMPLSKNSNRGKPKLCPNARSLFGHREECQHGREVIRQ
jgi:hypothetical protein